MSTEERRASDERRNLENRVTDLALGVAGLSGALKAVADALQNDVDHLNEEIDKQRKLSKYARRTWFEVMAYIFLLGMLGSDVGRRYCLGGDNGAAGKACDSVFWTTDHGGGYAWRVFGFFLQALVLFVMGRRSQVPADIFDDVPHAQVKRERHKKRWRRS